MCKYTVRKCTPSQRRGLSTIWALSLNFDLKKEKTELLKSIWYLSFVLLWIHVHIKEYRSVMQIYVSLIVTEAPDLFTTAFPYIRICIQISVSS